MLERIGEVVEKSIEDGEHFVALRIDVLDQDGCSTTPGEARVIVPSREDG